MGEIPGRTVALVLANVPLEYGSLRKALIKCLGLGLEEKNGKMIEADLELVLLTGFSLKTIKAEIQKKGLYGAAREIVIVYPDDNLGDLKKTWIEKHFKDKRIPVSGLKLTGINQTQPGPALNPTANLQGS